MRVVREGERSMVCACVTVTGTKDEAVYACVQQLLQQG